MTHPNDVVFWRNQPTIQIGAPSSIGFTHQQESLGVGVAQRGNVQYAFLHSTLTGQTFTQPTGGSVVALDNSAAGRNIVTLAPVVNTSQGDSSSGSTLYACGTTAGGITSSGILAGADGSDPLGADGCIFASGSGTPITLASLAITERCRVIRFAYVSGANVLPATPSPAKGGDFETSVNGTNGSDYGLRVWDQGTYEAGETVPAQTCTISSGSWRSITLCIKLLAPHSMIPQIVGINTAYAANAAGWSIATDAGFGAWPGGTFRNKDRVFVAATEQNGSGGAYVTPSGWTLLTDLADSTGAMWYKMLTSNDASATFQVQNPGFGSQFGASGSYIIIRGLDPTTPYSVAYDTETETTTHDAPDRTANRSTDISLTCYMSTIVGSTALSFTYSAGETFAGGGSNGSPGRRHAHYWSMRNDGLTPGTVAALTATCSISSQSARGIHLMAYAAPPIVLGEGEVSMELGWSASGTAFPSAVFGEGQSSLDVTVSARAHSFKPRRRTRRREYLWMEDIEGTVIGVIT